MMKRTPNLPIHLRLFQAILSLAVLTVGQLSAADQRPNIVFILADDLGYGDLSCFGADDIATPNIDRMAAEGAKLGSFCVSTVCSPTRAALMTGSHSTRVAIGGVMFPRNNHGLNPDEITLPELLKGQVYATAIIGKWHLGNQDMFQPLNHGFDYRHKELQLTEGLTQPHHAAKWWVWRGGILVPMIVRGPGIKAESVFKGNVVNYDFLPTFVDWTGGDPATLKDIDGVSLASYMAGEPPPDTFLNRSLYFHYPHYRSSMPHSAVVSGTRNLLHFYERPGLPMLFDLAEDRGEVHNIAPAHSEEHRRLYDEMMSYFDKVGARVPKLNPNYDAAVCRNSKEYEKRIQWGPFPIPRIAAIISLSCGAVLDLGICRCAGKGQGEVSLLRRMWSIFKPGDVLLTDCLLRIADQR